MVELLSIVRPVRAGPVPLDNHVTEIFCTQLMRKANSPGTSLERPSGETVRTASFAGDTRFPNSDSMCISHVNAFVSNLVDSTGCHVVIDPSINASLPSRG